MTVDAPDIEPRIKLPLQFKGCLDSQLDMEILFPLSIKIYGMSLFVFILHTFTITDCYFNVYIVLCTLLCYAGSTDVVESGSQSSVTSIRSNMILPGEYFFVGSMNVPWY